MYPLYVIYEYTVLYYLIRGGPRSVMDGLR